MVTRASVVQRQFFFEIEFFGTVCAGAMRKQNEAQLDPSSIKFTSFALL
jgi:hypothetical protein